MAHSRTDGDGKKYKRIKLSRFVSSRNISRESIRSHNVKDSSNESYHGEKNDKRRRSEYRRKSRSKHAFQEVAPGKLVEDTEYSSYEFKEVKTPTKRNAKSTASTSSSMDPVAMLKARNKFLRKVVPSGLVPMATANAMLILGATKSEADCSFPLPLYLVWTGSISLSLVVAGTVGRYIVSWIVANRRVRPGDVLITRILQSLGTLLVVVQVALLLTGTAVVFPELPYWQFQHKYLPNYCDFGIVLFMIVFITIAWISLIVVLCSSAFVICYSNRHQKKRMEERLGEDYYYEENPDQQYAMAHP